MLQRPRDRSRITGLEDVFLKIERVTLTGDFG
jgi:hypothetical protein